jgi:N-acetylneuraminate epimerase
MKLTSMHKLIALVSILFHAGGLAGKAAEPLQIGSRRELFVDRGMVEQLVGKAELRMHHPAPREIALVADKPWEGNGDTVSQPVSTASLPKMLNIRWSKGPNLPQGFQDSDGGVVRNTLISVGGFCSGQTNVAGKPAKYPRGFFKMVWGLDLRDPNGGWQALPDFPGVARQELFAAVVSEQLYCWGGFNYTTPFCYADGYRLSYHDGHASWKPLPSLPSPACSAGIAAIGSRIYVMGGADYDAERFYTAADRKGEHKGLGSRLLVLDTQDLAGGWKEFPACPGTPRFVHAAAAVNGRVYVIGGGTGNDNATGQYCTVVDNWCFDPRTAQWERLPDTPIATGNFPAGAISFQDRYVLLVGGYQYQKVLNPDGTT